MTLKDHIKQLVGEEEFNNVLSEVKENISVETKNFRNTKYISNGCLIIGFLCLFFPPFWIGVAIFLVIGMATHMIKAGVQKKLDIFNEVWFFLTEELENSEENIDRYKCLIDQL
ncbi:MULTISPECIES: hypothetical protein [Acinetobacter calcoaceticus/baumannii complex]|jgi:hypothetical protein|uniref:Uncharacterized protein n=2 Tax=Acinetobacter baumannii TaxID=470 RepID=A0AAX2VSK8_ACIBA|nr:hypothetical protein [Acinetobacter baumannii]AJB68919.1 hypothetical protein RU84_18795 [Acinetobacter baumannii]AVN23987.1 hypothetical protein CPI82_00260 [Acinetobacter baumannii]EHU1258158.1 hypothetical protein [Acinetobacter baumannii]EHU1262406.1 hypothetical protein [Acinetobacter baumannii]EHU1290771.1 hypothetical protein [Acinetobacter baumannii]